MKLYRNLPGYDRISRIERALWRGWAWYERDPRHMVIVIGVLSCVFFLINAIAYLVNL